MKTILIIIGSLLVVVFPVQVLSAGINCDGTVLTFVMAIAGVVIILLSLAFLKFKNVFKPAYPIIIFVVCCTCISCAQKEIKDECGCIKNVEKGQIIVPYINDQICVQFYVEGEYKFQVVYDTWKDLASDFQLKSKNEVLVVFDWKKISKINSTANLNAFVKEGNDGFLYIGMYFDNNLNVRSDKCKIADINTSCFHPSCNTKKLVYTIKVFLAMK